MIVPGELHMILGVNPENIFECGLQPLLYQLGKCIRLGNLHKNKKRNICQCWGSMSFLVDPDLL